MAAIAPKVALITGAAQGIGLATAQALAATGVNVVLADIDHERGAAESAKIAGARFIAADLTDGDACQALVAQVEREAGTIDILVNNAGIQHVAPIEDFPVAKWRQIIDMMLTAPFLLTQATLPEMYRRGWGRIVNLGSVHSVRASAYKSAYVAAKHGLLGLTRVTAIEAAAHGVTCNCICPSYVRTALVDKQIADQASLHNIPESEVVATIMVAEAPFRRLLEPAEVAAAVVYLCSDTASGITGSAFMLDGGWTAH